MNIYQKLQKMRVDLQNMNIKKTGENKFAGYKYYELGDILPPINKLLLDNNCMSYTTFTKEEARLTILDCEKPEDMLVFTSPMADATLKGAHDIQNLGAVETYQRRYLYMMAFEVVESDYFDATQGKGNGNNGSQSKGKQQKRPERKPVKFMSEEMSASLNDAIKGYCSLTGETTSAAVKRIEQTIGKTPKLMDDNDGEEALTLIKQWSDEYLVELGV